MRRRRRGDNDEEEDDAERGSERTRLEVRARKKRRRKPINSALLWPRLHEKAIAFLLESHISHLCRKTRRVRRSDTSSTHTEQFERGDAVCNSLSILPLVRVTRIARISHAFAPTLSMAGSLARRAILFPVQTLCHRTRALPSPQNTLGFKKWAHNAAVYWRCISVMRVRVRAVIIPRVLPVP